MKKNKLILNKNEILDILGTEYDTLADILSDKFGIINAMLERYELEEYNLYMYQCLSAYTRELFKLKKEVSTGGLGVHETKKGAMISCLAEALERYSMCFVPSREVKYSFLNDLDPNKIFSCFYTYSDNQYRKYSNIFSNPKKDKIHWTKIYKVDDKNNWKYWPASLVYLPFEYSKPIAENTSTGMAAGLSIKDCISSGLLELIERDALMINFLQRLNPPEIKIESIGGINREFIEKINKKYNIKIYKLYSDINVPIYLSLIWKQERKKKIHYGIGACASFDSDIAINKSLKECLFTFFYSKNIMDLKKENKEQINALYEHFLYYQGENFKKLLFKSKKIEYQHEKTKYEDVMLNLKSQNIEVYYKELTTDDIKNTNIKVVKVIAPGLIDLNKSHVLPRIGAERFWSVPKKLNLKYNQILSSLPHPFP